MTLFGSLKRDIFILSSSIGILGVVLGGFNMFVIIGVPVIFLIACFSRQSNSVRSRLIPGNVELGTLIFLVAYSALMISASTSMMLGNNIIGTLLGIVAAIAALYHVEAINRLFWDLFTLMFAAFGWDPDYLELAGTITLMVAYLVFLATLPPLAFFIVLCFWGIRAQQRASHLTGWNDTTN